MNRRMFEIEQTLAKLNAGSTRSYRLWPLPSYLDREISELVLNFSELPEAERAQVLGKITTMRSSWMLLAYAERMAQLGVREHSETTLFNAAVALVIEDFHEIAIDGFIILSLLVEESGKFVDEPNQFWARISGLATPKMAGFIDQALQTSAGQALSHGQLAA